MSRAVDVEILTRRLEAKVAEYSVSALNNHSAPPGGEAYSFGRHVGVVLGLSMAKELIIQMIKEADDERRPTIGTPGPKGAY